MIQGLNTCPVCGEPMRPFDRGSWSIEKTPVMEIRVIWEVEKCHNCGYIKSSDPEQVIKTWTSKGSFVIG